MQTILCTPGLKLPVSHIYKTGLVTLTSWGCCKKYKIVVAALQLLRRAYLPHARHCSKFFTYINSFNS